MPQTDHAGALDACGAAREQLRAEQDTAELLRDELTLREQQLAAMVAHLDASKAKSAAKAEITSDEVTQLRAAMSERDAQLTSLVQELCQLAGEEKDSPEVRSRLFRRSAQLFQELVPY
jgi:hypothetical protein